MTGASFAGLLGPVARMLLGAPNARLSSATDLRYGTNGSLSIDLEKDAWFDHEAGQGGGVLKLVTRETGRTDSRQWLEENGFGALAPIKASPSAAHAYDYTDERGEILFQVVRQEGPKRFRQRRPDGNGGWVWSAKGVRQVPYRLPDLLASPDAVVYVPEGEKDVDSLLAAGLVATCNAGGAGKWRAGHAEFLANREVVILPDNDDAGRAHARQVAESLRGIATNIRILELPGLPAKGDVSDWLAAGGDAEQLGALVREAGEAQPPAKALDAVPLADLMEATIEPPRFVVDPVIPANAVTLLGGHGGLGKTTLSLIIGAHVACGRGWGPFATSRCRVVVVSLEDSASVIRYRLRRIIEVYELPALEVIDRLLVLDGSGIDAALVSEVSTAGARHLAPTPLLSELEAAVAGAGLVIIDNASDGFDGDENARRQVRSFIRQLTSIARANDAGLVLLAHIDKSAAKSGAKGNSYSGGTAWHNSARSRLALIEDEGGIQLVHEKSNFGAKVDPVSLVAGAHGILVPAGRPGGRQTGDDLRAEADAGRILAVLVEAINAGLTVTTANSGPATAWHVLSSLPELGAEYRTAEGKRRVAAALVRLSRTGVIQRVEFRKPTRKPGERWALAQTDSGRAGEVCAD